MPIGQTDRPELMSTVERMILALAGQKGVELFRVADGKITLDQAAQVLSITRDELGQIISKLEGKFIHVEYEEEAEEKVEKKETVEPIDIPKKFSSGQFTLRTELTLEFGPSGSKIFDIVDGEKDLLQLSIAAGVTLAYTDRIIWWLARRGLLHFRQLKQEEIKNRYGSAGLRLYSEYGREGIYLYLLVEKYADAVPAIRASGIEAERAVEMCTLIYELISPPFTFDKRAVLDALRR